MPPRTIAMFNLSETTRDPRVRRVAGALAGAGHRVVVLGIQAERTVATEWLDGFELRRIALPASRRDWREMRQLRQKWPAAAELLYSVSHEVMETPSPVRYLGQRAIASARYRSWKLGQDLGIELPWRPSVSDRAREVANLRRTVLINLRLAETALALRPDVVHCNDLNSLIAGVVVKAQTGARLVYDAHEIYPEQFAADARSELWHAFYTDLERRLLPETDGRMTVCDSLGRYFEETYGAGAFTTIYNVPSLRLLPGAEILERKQRPRRILYHGVFFPFRGLEQVIAAAAELEGAELVLRGMGDLTPRLRALAAASPAAARIHILPPVDVDALIPAATACDIGLNPFISVCRNTEYALPNKLFEYMMAGLALGNADLPELRALTQKLGVGVLFDARQPSAIAAALNALVADADRLDACRRRAFEAARTEYHWERTRERFLHFYDAFL